MRTTFHGADARQTIGRSSQSLRWTFLPITVGVLAICGYPTVTMITTIARLPPSMLSIPYRLSLLAIALLALLSAWNRKHPRVDPAIVFFFVLYASRLVFDWHRGAVDGTGKAALIFFCATMLPTFAATWARGRDVPEGLWGGAILACAGFVVVSALVADQLGLRFNPLAEYNLESTRLSFEGLNPITLGHVSGLAILGSVYFLAYRRLRPIAIVVLLSILAASIYLILLANSRGPIVATAAGLLLLLSQRKWLLVIGGASALALLSASAFQGELLENVFSRFSSDSWESQSNLERMELMRFAWDRFREAPAFGSQVLIPIYRGASYPHNLYLDAAMALGVVGLGPLIFILGRAAHEVATEARFSHPLLSAILAKEFVGLHFSGALWGAEAFFVVLGIVLSGRARRPPLSRYGEA